MCASRGTPEEPLGDPHPGTTPLAHWRSADWRFLLASAPDLARVGMVPPPGAEESAVLAELGASVVTEASEVSDVDLVVVDADAVPGAVIGSGSTVVVRLHHGLRGALRGHPAKAPELRGLEQTRRTVYWHAPNRHRCSYVVDLDDRLAVSAMLRRYHGVRLGLVKSLVARTLNRLGLARLLARDLSVVARPSDAPAAGRDPGVPELLVTPWFEASRHVVRLALDPTTGQPRGVTKLPRRPWDTAGIQHEAAVLTELSRLTSRLRGRVPEVIELSTGPVPGLHETAVGGVAVEPGLVRRDPARAVGAAIAFVTELPRTGTTREHPGWFADLVEAPLAEIAVAVPQSVELVEETRGRLEELRHHDLPLVLEHGDLSHPNLFLDAAGRLGAVDWERAQVRGLPGHDLFFFLQYAAESRRSTFERSGQVAAFDETFIGSRTWVSDVIAQHLGSLGVPEPAWPALLLATFARSSAGLVRRLAGTSRTGVGAVPTDFVDTFLGDRDFALWRHAARSYDRLLG